jgi:cytochrome c-type biogenesis protein CcmH/NrfG
MSNTISKPPSKGILLRVPRLAWSPAGWGAKLWLIALVGVTWLLTLFAWGYLMAVEQPGQPLAAMNRPFAAEFAELGPVHGEFQFRASSESL